MWPSLSQWAEIGAVVGGFGAAGAFAGTIVLLNMQRRQLEAALRQEADREIDRRQEQARLVAAWCIEVKSAGGGQSEIVVAIANRSDEPVYDSWVGVRASWEDEKIATAGGQVGVLGPDTRRELKLEFRPRVRMVRSAPIDLFFTDANGRRWHRAPEGQLKFASPRLRPPHPVIDGRLVSMERPARSASCVDQPP